MYATCMILFISPKDKYATQRILEECAQLGVGVLHRDIDDLAKQSFDIDIALFDVLYIRQAYPYFDQAISLAKRFHAEGKYVVDSSFIQDGMEASKRSMYAALVKHEIVIPEIRNYEINTEFPFVLKWIYGFGSKDVYLIHNSEEYQNVITTHPQQEWIHQEYINAEKEYEVYVLGGKAVPTILEYKTHNDFQVDVKSGRGLLNAEQNPLYNTILNLAEKAAEAAKKEISKVDIIERAGKLYVLEVNRGPGLISFESILSYNIARDIVKYLQTKETHMKSIMEKPGTEVPTTPPTAPTTPQEPVNPVM